MASAVVAMSSAASRPVWLFQTAAASDRWSVIFSSGRRERGPASAARVPPWCVLHLCRSRNAPAAVVLPLPSRPPAAESPFCAACSAGAASADLQGRRTDASQAQACMRRHARASTATHGIMSTQRPCDIRQSSDVPLDAAQLIFGFRHFGLPVPSQMASAARPIEKPCLGTAPFSCVYNK